MNIRRRESGRWARVVCIALLVSGSIGSMGAQSGPPAGSPVVPAPPAPRFTLGADREDVITLLRRLAAEAAVSVAFATDVKGTATISLHQASFAQAVSLITGSAGLSFREMGGMYLITTANAASSQVASQAFYRAQHVRADRLADSLRAIFPTGQLRVLLGPDEYNSPTLSPPPASGSSSSSGTTSGSSGSGGGLSLDLSGLAPPPTAPPPASAATATQGGPGAHQLVLIGDAPVVAQALELCKTLDVRRRQARIDVKISDIDLEALREFGVKWSWNSHVTAREQPGTPDATLVPVFNFGTFLRDPVFITAAVSALELQGRSKLLATPSVSLLDGERASIFIGSKHLYPQLTGYSSSQTPIYDTKEVSVGIRLDVSVAMTDSDDMILTLYPQVSAIKSTLEVAGTFYPQVETREQQTTIRARSGETVMIGGLIKEGEINGYQGVPGLSKIPVLGELFKYRKKTTTRTDLVIMITPQILADEK